LRLEIGSVADSISNLPALVQPLQLHRGDAAFSLLQGKTDTLAFGQLAQSGALHGADMDENIVATFFRRYEAIALARVEPFNDTNMRFTGRWIDSNRFRLCLGCLHFRNLLLSPFYRA
jgi:hypothetical protein